MFGFESAACGGRVSFDWSMEQERRKTNLQATSATVGVGFAAEETMASAAGAAGSTGGGGGSGGSGSASAATRADHIGR